MCLNFFEKHSKYVLKPAIDGFSQVRSGSTCGFLSPADYLRSLVFYFKFEDDFHL